MGCHKADLIREGLLETDALDARLCQVVGLNQNYSSSAGTPYHIQIEDRGPLFDSATERNVRRVNVIVYANYGEPNARIIYGRDHDFPDVRTQGHNRFIEAKVQELAVEARGLIEEREQRLVLRVKAAIHSYYLTKDEAAKLDFEEINSLYPFLFSRAWREMKEERARSAPPPSAPVAEAEEPIEVVYPMDARLREQVLDIERLIADLIGDVSELRSRGAADDILIQTCRKLVARARDTLQAEDASDFGMRRLESTRSALATTWRQVRSRLVRA